MMKYIAVGGWKYLIVVYIDYPYRGKPYLPPLDLLIYPNEDSESFQLSKYLLQKRYIHCDVVFLSSSCDTQYGAKLIT